MKYKVFLFLLILSNCIYAQQVIVPTGQNLVGNGGSANATIGYTPYIIDQSAISGVQQPYISIATIIITTSDSDTIQQLTHNIGEEIVLRVYPTDNCSQFVQWSDGNTNNPRTVTVTKDATYTAEFEKIKYKVSVKTDNPQHGTVNVEQIE